MAINIQQLKSDLIHDEGVVQHAYQDHLGYWTIGVGRLIDGRKGGQLSMDEIEYLLNNDIKRIIKELDNNISWWVSLSDARKLAIANMCFQLGITKLLKFKNMLSAMRSGNFDKAADEALDSLWAKQTPSRANRIADIIRGV